MEAPRATDSPHWRDAVVPDVEERLVVALDELADFPVLDATVLRVLAIVDDPESSTGDLVNVLEADPSFAANLLRFANSAALSTPIRAKTIRQAVMLAGRKVLRRLALESATYRFLERAKGNGAASRGELHLHAISVASIAAATAEAVRSHGETPHLAGLLHDVGKLVLPMAFGEAACDAVARSAGDGTQRVVSERETLGIDHALAGALLAERWGLPDEVAAAIAFHHGGPSGVATPTIDAACVQLANEVDRVIAGDAPDHALVEVALDCAGLTPTSLDVIARQAMPAGAAPLEEGALARRVTELDRLSQTDELTGVDNRRHWLQATRTELTTSGAGAVLLVDVDDLDRVNDQHGMSVGDLVLTEVGRIVAHFGRAGRLGGDLFAVWIREGAEVAGAAAEAVVAQVRGAFPGIDGPQVTVSVGQAAGVPGSGEATDLAALLEAAAAGLRGAKDIARPRVPAAETGSGPAAPLSAAA
jgi:diguanylate cyclase (GGDEF)-like protein/putative nucleotidyltransferase with HDIG domain